MTNVCPVETRGLACGRPVRSLGLCQAHYYRQKRHGDVQADVPIIERGDHVGAADAPGCSVDGCTRAHHAHGFCRRHYQQSSRGETPTSELSAPGWQKQCLVPVCGKHQATRGFCEPHYQRWYQKGDPMWENPARSECGIDGCDTGAKTVGLCSRHYGTLKKLGHDRTRYRTRTGPCEGRCEVCRWDHAREARERRQAAIESGPLSFETRREIVAQLWGGVALDTVAEDAGVTVRQLWSIGAAFPEFVDAMDQALLATRDPDIDHGTGYSYRTYGCRCPECRAGKAAVR